MPSKYYYHVTTRDKLPLIFKEGLKPMIGKNSSTVNEDDPAIYLCRRRDVPHWLILTQGDVVLKIDEQGLDMPLWSWSYDNYDEYRTETPIDPKWISKAGFPGKQARLSAMQDLARSHIYAISYMCFAALQTEHRWLRENLSEEQEARTILDAKIISDDIKTNVGIMSHIDFSTITRKEIAKIVREHSNEDCYVTFADSYYNKDFNPDIPDAGKRCWEHLANLEMDELKEAGKELRGFIRKVIPAYVRKLPNIGGFSM